MKINNVDKLRYLESMIQPYEKKKQKKYFIEQFLNGSGNELIDKFWELKSSSRMAYDLYSWMKDDENIKDFEFEFKLPGLKSGGNGPNMDVFIETEDELIFIESKFTEKANLHYTDNGNLSEAYYRDGEYGKKQLKLVDRFYGNEWAEKFSIFCTDWKDTMEKNGWHKGSDWFEPKQETCHLSGILLFLFDTKNKKIIKNKKIRLYNIFWNIDNDIYSDMEKKFCENAQNLINNIIQDEGKKLGVTDFKIDAFSVQEMFKGEKNISDHIIFPDDLKERIIKRNEDILKKENITSR